MYKVYIEVLGEVDETEVARYGDIEIETHGADTYLVLDDQGNHIASDGHLGAIEDYIETMYQTQEQYLYGGPYGHWVR